MPAYDFTRLSAFDFEELILDLLQADWKASFEIFTPGRDGGVDLRAFSDSKEETIVQCKHMPNTMFAKLLAHLKKEELPKVRALAPKRYVLATSLGLSPANTKALAKLFKPYLKRQSDVYGRDRINALLCRHKKVETANFKLWLTSTAVLQRVRQTASRRSVAFAICGKPAIEAL
ncbi:restriction endonuclease [Bradyrhizobium lablabi]|uniref:restriction endonuclease n=1 Tax=Bradyrhizobium lablabi TaxID=722472 RepID=UPI001BA45247|nr:restriction endonuclease [Bradyrhizobium lablabi]MBR0692557.1 restriction endonuclease [Bradyrhizobium lablabi]